VGGALAVRKDAATDEEMGPLVLCRALKLKVRRGAPQPASCAVHLREVSVVVTKCMS